MSKITIYVPAMALLRIKSYAKEKNIPLSRLFVRGALSMAKNQIIPKCDFCTHPSMGKYQIVAYTWDSGEQTTTKYLCSFHLKKAQAEGEVKEVN